MSQREDIEDAVIALINPLLKPALPNGAAGGYLEHVGPYQGSLDPDPEDSALVELMKRGVPAVGVTTDAADFGDIMLRQQRGMKEISIEILVVSRNLRGLESAARGDGLSRDPGVYQILEDIRLNLMGVEMGVGGVGYLTPERELPVERGATSIWRQSYSVDVDTVQAALDATDASYVGITTRISDVDTDDEDANPITTADVDF